MKQKVSLFLLLTLLSGVAVAAEAVKPRIAVIGFSEKGGRSVGKASEDWFTDELVKSKKFSVMERQQMQSILSEHHLQLGSAFDQQTAVKAGKMLGIQLAVYGNINFSEKSDGVHSSGLSVRGVSVPWGSGSRRVGEGTLNVRLVNVQTGEILYSGEETVSDSSLKISVMGTGGGTDMDETKIRKIFQPAVSKLVKQIVAKSGDIRSVVAGSGAEGKVVRVKADEVLINLGSLDGVVKGDKFEVMRGEVIVDPDTKQVLGRDETTIGSLTISRVLSDHLSAGSMTSGAEASQGDVVKGKK